MIEIVGHGLVLQIVLEREGCTRPTTNPSQLVCVLCSLSPDRRQKDVLVSPPRGKRKHQHWFLSQGGSVGREREKERGRTDRYKGSTCHITEPGAARTNRCRHQVRKLKQVKNKFRG